MTNEHNRKIKNIESKIQDLNILVYTLLLTVLVSHIFLEHFDSVTNIRLHNTDLFCFSSYKSDYEFKYFVQEEEQII